MHLYLRMLNGLKAEFRQLKNAPAGHRFIACYERHQAREAPWLKPILYFAAIFSLVIGMILVFIPGPAILFFAIAGALLAAESRSVAAAFDNVECWCRSRYAALRGRSSGRKKREARATTKALSPQAVAVIAARAERVKEGQTRREMKRPSVRGSAELVPQSADPPRGVAASARADQDAHPATAASQLGAADASHDVGRRADAAPVSTPLDIATIGARESQRDAVMPSVAVVTPIGAAKQKQAPRSTQAYAEDMQTQPRQEPERVAGTVQLWAGDLPATQPSNSKTTARQRRPRKRATKPSIVKLPPPVIIGGGKA